MGPDKFAEHQQRFQELKTSLNHQDRLTILELKKQLRTGETYRNRVTSVDVYRAVIAGVTDVETFEMWHLS